MIEVALTEVKSVESKKASRRLWVDLPWSSMIFHDLPSLICWVWHLQRAWWVQHLVVVSLSIARTQAQSYSVQTLRGPQHLLFKELDRAWVDERCLYINIYIYTVKMKVRMPPRIPNIPPPQLECGPRTAKNPSVRMPPHPGFKFFCFWRTLCTNPSLRMPPHYEYHQLLECS